jgi:hypothetical protein
MGAACRCRRTRATRCGRTRCVFPHRRSLRTPRGMTGPTMPSVTARGRSLSSPSLRTRTSCFLRLRGSHAVCLLPLRAQNVHPSYKRILAEPPQVCQRKSFGQHRVSVARSHRKMFIFNILFSETPGSEQETPRASNRQAPTHIAPDQRRAGDPEAPAKTTVQIRAPASNARVNVSGPLKSSNVM